MRPSVSFYPEVFMVKQALAQYQQVNVATGVEGASPHRLIQMLMQGFLQRLAEAKGALARGDVAARGVALGKAIDIAIGLQTALNKEVEGGLPQQLDALYDYMQTRLLEANARADAAMIDEVAGLMRTVKEGWDGIADQVAA
jgi:flagellar protein FliS